MPEANKPYILYARRWSDRQYNMVEEQARTLAMLEGPCSPIYDQLNTVDELRLTGSRVHIVKLYRNPGDQFHNIVWVEEFSPAALTKDHVQTVGWTALAVGFMLGIAVGFSWQFSSF